LIRDEQTLRRNVASYRDDAFFIGVFGLRELEFSIEQVHGHTGSPYVG
jgi:hypothetical protein